MNITHAENTPWSEPRRVRGGIIRFKYMLEGREGTPTNFCLLLADTDISFKSPRHRHNFDQIRVTLEGSTNYGPRQNIEVGDVVYFPEGTHYGPQDQSLAGASSLAMVIQFGGASGSGYMSARQLLEGHQELEKVGRFEGGVFRRDDASEGDRRNQDGYEAVWEQQNGRKLVYPKARMTEPVHFRAANVPWQAVADSRGAWVRELGAFSERNIRISGLKIDAGAGHTLAPIGQERLVFFLTGAGDIAPGGRWTRHSAVHLGPDEALALSAGEATEALVLVLPRFTGDNT